MLAHNRKWLPPAGLAEPRPDDAALAFMNGLVRMIYGPDALPATDRPWRRVEVRGGTASCPACGRRLVVPERLISTKPRIGLRAAVCACGSIVWDPRPL